MPENELQTPVQDDFFEDQSEAGVEITIPDTDEDGDDERGVGGGDFVPRLTAPSKTNKYYITTKYGGLNKCILGKPQYSEGSALANCVGGEWGCAYEHLGKEPKLPRSNAENWWGYTKDGYERSQVPRLGDVACWRKGKAGDASDGAGHVASVEEIFTKNGKTHIRLWNSGWGGPASYLTTYEVGKMSHGKYTFQGFIHILEEEQEDAPLILYNSGIIKSVSGGTKISASAQKAAVSGHACDLYIEFGAGKLPSGETITVQLNDKFFPAVPASGCGYWSKSAFIAQLSEAGKLTIRNTGASRTFDSKKPLRIAISYLIKD